MVAVAAVVFVGSLGGCVCVTCELLAACVTPLPMPPQSRPHWPSVSRHTPCRRQAGRTFGARATETLSTPSAKLLRHFGISLCARVWRRAPTLASAGARRWRLFSPSWCWVNARRCLAAPRLRRQARGWDRPLSRLQARPATTACQQNRRHWTSSTAPGYF